MKTDKYLTQKAALAAAGYKPKVGPPRKIQGHGVLLAPLWVSSATREALEAKAAALGIHVADARRAAIDVYLSDAMRTKSSMDAMRKESQTNNREDV